MNRLSESDRAWLIMILDDYIVQTLALSREVRSLRAQRVSDGLNALALVHLWIDEAHELRTKLGGEYESE